MVFRFSSNQTETNGPDARLGYGGHTNTGKKQQIKVRKNCAKRIIHLPRQLEWKVVERLELLGLRGFWKKEITTI